MKEFSPWVADRLLTANVGRKGPDKAIVHPRQAGEYARVQSVVLSTAGANQFDLPCIRHNHFVHCSADSSPTASALPLPWRSGTVCAWRRTFASSPSCSLVRYLLLLLRRCRLECNIDLFCLPGPMPIVMDSFASFAYFLNGPLQTLFHSVILLHKPALSCTC